MASAIDVRSFELLVPELARILRPNEPPVSVVTLLP
jgi:hypothetical protein